MLLGGRRLLVSSSRAIMGCGWSQSLANVSESTSSPATTVNGAAADKWATPRAPPINHSSNQVVVMSLDSNSSTTATSPRGSLTTAYSATSSGPLKSSSSVESTRSIHTLRQVTDSSAIPSRQQAVKMSTGAGDASYGIQERGSLFNLNYRLFTTDANGKIISPWHDVPLFADEEKGIYHMIVEIPRWTNAKMEMATKEAFSPIKQDEKKGVARFVHNIFPHKGYIWNYGALPQTWEDPNHVVPDTGAKGDNDPIDVIEIGSKVAKRGAVLQVKVLGTLALIDEGETDWKIVAIDVNDKNADKLNDINDVETVFPGLLAATVEWFRIYKIPAGKPANEFAFNGEFKNRSYAEKTIAETNAYWKALIKQTTPELNTVSHVPEAVHQATDDAAASAVAAHPEHGAEAALPEDVDKWHFVQG